MRRWAPFGLLLIALAVLAWRWTGAGRAAVDAAGDGDSAARRGAGPAGLAPDPRAAELRERRSRPQPHVTGQVLEGDRRVRARVQLFSRGAGRDEARPDVHWTRWALPAEGIGRAVADVDTDEEGAFEVQGLDEARFLVVARALSGARGWSVADTRPVPRAGARARVVVRVDGGREVLRGRVRTAEGAPWRGFAGVGPEGAAAMPPEAFALQATDGEGRFEVPDLPTGPAQVALFEAGRVRYDGRRVSLPHAGELDIVLPSAGPETRCVVRDAETAKPVVGAEVGSGGECALDAIGHVWWTAHTDAAGEARLPIGTSGLLVQAAGYEPRQLSTEERSPVVEVRLRALRAVDVLVVEAETKAPVEGALVVAFEMALVPRRGAHTDRDGRCRLVGLPSAAVAVAVRGGGWCSAELAGLPPDGALPWPSSLFVEESSSGAGSLTREAVRLALVSGTVRDGEGRPVADAAVTVLARTAPFTIAGEDEPALATGPDGRFEGRALVPGAEYDLEVRAAGQVPTLAGPVRSAAGERVVRDVRLDGGRFVAVRVVDLASRAPVVGARAYASVDLGSRPDRPGPRWCTLSAATDAGGLARLGPLPRLTTRIDVEAAGWTGGRNLTPVPADAPAEVSLEVALTRQDLRIAGRVRFEDATSPRDVRLTLAQAVPGYSSRVDEQGQFLVEGLTPGEHVLEFRYGDVEEILHSRTVTAGEAAVEVVLPPPRHRGLSFRVLGADGRPIGSCAYVFGIGDGAEWGRAERGFARVRPFEGMLFIVFSDAQDEDGRPLDAAPTPVGPLDGDGRTIEVRLRGGRPTAGRVVDEEGRGIEGVTVRAWPLEPPTSPDPTLRELSPGNPLAATDASGRFVLHGLDVTLHRVYVDVPKGFAEPASVDVRGGDPDLRLVVPRPTDVVVSVVDPAGRPVVGAVVTRLLGSPGVPTDPTDAAGHATLTSVSPEVPVALKLSPPKDRADLRGIENVGWRRGDPPIVLPAAASLGGVVVDEAGAPVRDAEVWAIDADQKEHSTRSDEGGRFTFLRLPLGPSEVFAMQEERPRLVSRRVRAPAGTGDVRLVLTRGAALRVRVEGGAGPLEDEEVVLHSADGVPADATADLDVRGVATFEGLEPRASYSLHFAVEEPRRLVALARDVRGDAGEVILRLEPLGTLVGAVRGAPRGSYVGVSIREHGLSLETTARSDGVFALADVPPGPFTIRAECETPTGRLVGTARGSTAARVEIELAPAPTGPR